MRLSEIEYSQGELAALRQGNGSDKQSFHPGYMKSTKIKNVLPLTQPVHFYIHLDFFYLKTYGRGWEVNSLFTNDEEKRRIRRQTCAGLTMINVKGGGGGGMLAQNKEWRRDSVGVSKWCGSADILGQLQSAISSWNNCNRKPLNNRGFYLHIRPRSRSLFLRPIAEV